MEEKAPAHGVAYWTTISNGKDSYRVRVEAFAAEAAEGDTAGARWHWNWFANRDGAPIAGGFDRGISAHGTFEEALRAGEMDAEIVLRLGKSEKARPAARPKVSPAGPHTKLL